jgi:rod shape determining protein RodA
MNRGLDKPLLIVVALLAIFGLVIVYSTGQTDMIGGGTGFSLRQVRWLWVMQVIYLFVGVCCAAVVYHTSFRIIEWATPWLYGFSLGLLALTLVIGHGAGAARSEKSWIGFGGVNLQPVEIAKLATILMLARWFASRREPPTTLRGLLTPIALTAVPVLLVLKQPDLGSAIVFAGILFGVMFWAAVPFPLLVFLASPIVSLVLSFNTTVWSLWMIGLFVMLLVWRPFVWEGIFVYVTNSVMGVLALLVWARMAVHQRARIISFLNPESDPTRTGYHAVQSRVAIGSGGWLGTGLGQGPQKRAGYIPERTTDFIFSVVGEELGFVGVIVALGLFVLLLFSLVRIARQASDPFTSLAVFGVTSLVLTHVFENVGMTISIMPITGIPLPFFSAGGSFLMALAIGLGMAFRAAEEGRAASYVES